MNNPLALSLKESADKYLEHNETNWEDDEFMLQCGRKDYGALMKVAEMIENDLPDKEIAKAMWRLDTIVRDVIPDDVYYTYN